MPARTGAERRVSAEERRARRAAVEDASVVMAAAANFLSVRMRSVAETRARLLHLGYPSGLVDATVSRLVELDYLDDTVFARTWVESRDRAHPRGQIRLRRELAIKGIGRDVVDLVMDERGTGIRDDDIVAGGGDLPAPVRPFDRSAADRAAALSLLKRRGSSLLREPDPRRRQHKAYSLLARNGFDPDICRAASAGFLGGADDETDWRGGGLLTGAPPRISVSLVGQTVHVDGPLAQSFGHRIARPGAPDDGIFGEWRWDGEALTVSTDRYGFQPLFWRGDERSISVSPSLLALVPAGAGPAELDYEALAVFARLGFYLNEDTPFRGISAMPPGGRLEWRAGKLSVGGARHRRHRPEHLAVIGHRRLHRALPGRRGSTTATGRRLRAAVERGPGLTAHPASAAGGRACPDRLPDGAVGLAAGR